ncbi:MAG: succinylglutamate desuccinylase/aspartoacylase family protein [Leptospiraceae bacterium]|nr:succinylglutamate desuccinylase/aspartoacylase family protein [Leptospiraceae bacterium]
MSVFDSKTDGSGFHKSLIPFEEDASQRSWLMPYLIKQGRSPGRKITIIAAIHGDELNGVRILHELAAALEPIDLAGSLCLVPVANLMGYANHSRYLPDRRDLNRMFPGLKDGSEGARLAHFLWTHFIAQADVVLDLHSGSYNRWNFPHLRGNMKDEAMRAWASRIEGQVILTSSGVAGSLRKEAGKIGKPVFLIEAGETGRFEKKILQMGLTLLVRILESTETIGKEDAADLIRNYAGNTDRAPHAPGYYRKAVWQRATCAGLFMPAVSPGDRVEAGQPLGHITDLFGERRAEILSEQTGFVLGMHLHPQVVPGRALFHIAYEFKELH